MGTLDLTLAPETDPTAIYRYRDGMLAVDLLTAALTGLDFFTWLNEHPSDQKTICRALELKERPVDVMLTLFVAMGLLQREQEIFRLTKMAREHLVKGSPWHLAPYFAAVQERPSTKDMLTVLRTGQPANWASLQHEKEWAKAMEEEQFAEQFTAAMDCRGVLLGQAVARTLDLKAARHLLDIAGGSGIYACAIAAQHPHLKATVLEKPPVDEVARRAIAKRGFAQRVGVLAGDMFADPLPDGCDVHLISNVLHDWDVPVVKKLLAKSFEALPPGGLLVIHDAYINADKSGPLHVAEYSVLLMQATEGKCYSVAEMESFLSEAGFGEFNFAPTAVHRSIVTARRPLA
jgi:predicted O-methyltransferase YrrM